jgi:hypothetical protein
MLNPYVCGQMLRLMYRFSGIMENAIPRSRYLYSFGTLRERDATAQKKLYFRKYSLMSYVNYIHRKIYQNK